MGFWNTKMMGKVVCLFVFKGKCVRSGRNIKKMALVARDYEL